MPTTTWKVTVEGELLDLKVAAGQIPADVIASALEPGLREIVARAKSLCPVDSGNLRSAIAYKISNTRDMARGVVFGIVGIRRRAKGKPTKYAHLVEFGHATSPSFRKRAKTKERFVPAKPFLRPALEGSKAGFVTQLGKRASDQLAVKMTAISRKRKIKVEL